jgi:CPA1 family monovalent cation:H+ antiporter
MRLLLSSAWLDCDEFVAMSQKPSLPSLATSPPFGRGCGGAARSETKCRAAIDSDTAYGVGKPCFNMRSPFDLLALLLALAATFGWLNHRLLRLPLTVGLLLLALGGAVLLIGADAAMPGLGLKPAIRGILDRVDFPSTLLNGFLSFLLFAGALEVDFTELFARKWTVLALATLGTVLSTGLVGVAFFGVSAALGLGVPFLWCLLFGALISPTDPVAVLLVLRRVGIPQDLQATIAGESLFNDGIGVVLFSLLLSLALNGGAHPQGPLAVAGLFLLAAVGGGMLGLALGCVAFLLIRSVDDYNVELIISLALVTVTYSLAGSLHVSGPVAVVVAGILMGHRGMEQAMSDATRRHLETFWLLVDDTLNALLFLLIGLEIAAIDLAFRALAATVLMIPLVLGIRWLSVAASALPLNLRLPGRFAAFVILTWGGLRGGISVAMALALPATPHKPAMLTVAYGIVVFSIVVQGLSLEWVARRSVIAAEPASPAADAGGGIAAERG